MKENKYTGCSVEELLHNTEFVSEIKQISSPEEWEHFLRIHHESKTNILHARELIQLFQTSEGNLDQERRNLLWSNIQGFNIKKTRSNKRIELKIFARIAASILIVISLGGLLYQYFNQEEIQYQFSESQNVSKNENSVLVLSNGKTFELGENEAKVTVLKGQDAIQINNEQIIENQTYIDQTTNASKLNEVIVPYCKKSKLILEDGTTVWLNAGSRFAFPSKFLGNRREVVLDGEACFEVAKNSQNPFIVSTGDINIEVTGTKFNICAYRSDNLTEAVLLEGSINIWDNGRFITDKISMVPNQKATYNKTGKDIVLKPELDPASYIAWVDGWYPFANEDIAHVLKKLERHYNITFECNEATKTRILPVSGKLDLKESLNEVLAVLSKVAKFDYQISGEIVTIENNLNNQ